MTSLRTRTWPGPSCVGALSTSAKFSGVGQPTGRDTSWTSRGLGIGSPSGSVLWRFRWVSVARVAGRAPGWPRSLDDELDRDVAARRIGVGAHLVRDVDELPAELTVDILGQLDVQDHRETEVLSTVPAQADVGGDGGIEVLHPALARHDPQSACEARGIPGREELLRVGAFTAAAELTRCGEGDVEAAVGGDGAPLAARGHGRCDVLGGLSGGRAHWCSSEGRSSGWLLVHHYIVHN